MKLVFDIETVGFEFNSLSESQQEYLMRYAEKESDDALRQQMKDEVIRYLNLYPYTAKIVSIGLLNVETEKLLVLFEQSEEEEIVIEDKNIKYKAVSEKEMISMFWNYMEKTEKVITFNGRMFDIPFLMLRSAVLQIKPSKNILGYRYDTKTHIDLLDQLTFHGMTKKFNLDFYCHAFGIESPKSKGVSGMDVNELYRAGKIKDIAVYNGKDVQATYELYKIWNEYLNI